MFRKLDSLQEMWDGYTIGLHNPSPAFTNWQPWFAWRPVRLMNNKWTWLKRIYRRASLRDGGEDWMRRDKQVYHYGTVFDVLANPDQNN